ncbi:MAG TPA: hypothetical protein VE641_21745 [Chthoniobacterales bacterium]|nr:hypothetical protein [Chthoniobacterales bacterium]
MKKLLKGSVTYEVPEPASTLLREDEFAKRFRLARYLTASSRSFASVFLAFSLFGFLFPHKADQIKQNHHVNLITTEQAAQPEPADDGSVYEWFY